jgi:hypothetical protein
MSKRSLILQDFLNGKSHTSLSIAKKFNTTQGMRRIYELIDLGFPLQITKMKMKNGTYYNQVSM